MAIRLRRTNVGLVALCAARSVAKSGDIYLDDEAHRALSDKFSRDPKECLNIDTPTNETKSQAAAVEYLGYGVVVVRIDAAALTGQSRQRDFVVGHLGLSRDGVKAVFPTATDSSGPYTTRLGTREIAPALTTHQTRYDSRDCYVWEPGSGLRILDGIERERLAGFPERWAVGFSEAARAKMLGNAVVPQIAEFLGRAILEAETASQL